jgi:hypothetical protein
VHAASRRSRRQDQAGRNDFYVYLGEAWEYVAIQSLNDGFASIVESRSGFPFSTTSLPCRVGHQVAGRARHRTCNFIKKVRRTKKARFVLTTRALIFEEARRVSAHFPAGRSTLRNMCSMSAFTPGGFTILNGLTQTEFCNRQNPE